MDGVNIVMECLLFLRSPEEVEKLKAENTEEAPETEG